MKITIEATPEEVAKLLQAIGSSKEQPNDLFTFPGGSSIIFFTNSAH